MEAQEGRRATWRISPGSENCPSPTLPPLSLPELGPLAPCSVRLSGCPVGGLLTTTLSSSSVTGPRAASHPCGRQGRLGSSCTCLPLGLLQGESATDSPCPLVPLLPSFIAYTVPISPLQAPGPLPKCTSTSQELSTGCSLCMERPPPTSSPNHLLHPTPPSVHHPGQRTPRTLFKRAIPNPPYLLSFSTTTAVTS